jgi:putative transposase
MRKTYSSDVSDVEWEILEPFFPEAQWYPNLQEPKHTRREIVNAVLYRMRTGCQWENLPHDFPPWKTVNHYYSKWRNEGLIARLHSFLRGELRRMTPYKDGMAREESASVCIMDSQSVKTSEEGSSKCGYDGGKHIKGRKRHIIVDMLGLVLAIKVTAANVQDRVPVMEMLSMVKHENPSLEVAIMDGGYRGPLEADIKKR